MWRAQCAAASCIDTKHLARCLSLSDHGKCCGARSQAVAEQRTLYSWGATPNGRPEITTDGPSSLVVKGAGHERPRLDDRSVDGPLRRITIEGLRPSSLDCPWRATVTSRFGCPTSNSACLPEFLPSPSSILERHARHENAVYCSDAASIGRNCTAVSGETDNTCPGGPRQPAEGRRA